MPAVGLTLIASWGSLTLPVMNLTDCRTSRERTRRLF